MSFYRPCLLTTPRNADVATGLTAHARGAQSLFVTVVNVKS